MKKKALLSSAVLFFTVGGVNHFINPQFYLPLIPPYLLYKEEINFISGLVEIAGAIGLLFGISRKWASYGLCLMLMAFIPSHVYFLKIGSCVSDGLCVPDWIAWIRLIVIHPMFIWWVYYIKD